MQEMIRRGIASLGPEAIKRLPREWTIASSCSGTGNFELSAKAVAKALNMQLSLKNEEKVEASSCKLGGD